MSKLFLPSAHYPLVYTLLPNQFIYHFNLAFIHSDIQDIYIPAHAWFVLEIVVRKSPPEGVVTTVAASCPSRLARK